MKVWIVSRIDWEGREIMGVYANREKATAVRDDYAAADNQLVPPYKWNIECCEVED